MNRCVGFGKRWNFENKMVHEFPGRNPAACDIWEKGVIEARSKISQKRPKSGLFEPERLRGHYVVTTRSLRGHYAVTTVTTRSLRGHYAVTTVTTRSLRGHYAVTTVTTRSPRGHYAVKKSCTFEAEKTFNFAPKRPIRSRHCCHRPRRL